MCQEKVRWLIVFKAEMKRLAQYFVLRRLLLKVNGSVNVGQIAFLSTAEKIADELRNRELGIPAELVEEQFILVRNRSMNIFIALKFLLGSDNSHIFSLVVVNSWSATLIIQNLTSFFD